MERGRGRETGQGCQDAHLPSPHFRNAQPVVFNGAPRVEMRLARRMGVMHRPSFLEVRNLTQSVALDLVPLIMQPIQEWNPDTQADR
jgi:hypothetical protein